MSFLKRGSSYVLVALNVALAAGCARASISKVRKAETGSLCVQKALVVVEVVENMGNRHILEPLRARLEERGVAAQVIEAGSVTDLREPSISGPIGTYQPQAVLVVDWQKASLWGTALADPSSENRFKLSLYQYTQEHNLVEVWKANMVSRRTFTLDPGIEPQDAEKIAVEIVEELGESKLIPPCEAEQAG